MDNHSSFFLSYLLVAVVVVVVALPSAVMYFCKESLRLAYTNSNLLLAYLFIISNRVFLRMGLSLSPRTLNSTE